MIALHDKPPCAVPTKRNRIQEGTSTKSTAIVEARNHITRAGSSNNRAQRAKLRLLHDFRCKALAIELWHTEIKRRKNRLGLIAEPWPRTLVSERLIHRTDGIAADTDAGQRRAGGTSGELVSRPATETRTDESPEQGWLEPHTLPHTLSRSALLAGQGVLVRSRERRWACRIRISRRGDYIVSARGQATPPADV